MVAYQKLSWDKFVGLIYTLSFTACCLTVLVLFKFHHSTHSMPPEPCRTLYWWKCSKLRGVAILKPHPFIHDLQKNIKKKSWCFLNIHGGEFFRQLPKKTAAFFVPSQNFERKRRCRWQLDLWTLLWWFSKLPRRCLGRCEIFLGLMDLWTLQHLTVKKRGELRPLFLSRYLLSTIISMHIISSCYSRYNKNCAGKKYHPYLPLEVQEERKHHHSLQQNANLPNIIVIQIINSFLPKKKYVPKKNPPGSSCPGC